MFPPRRQDSGKFILAPETGLEHDSLILIRKTVQYMKTVLLTAILLALVLAVSADQIRQEGRFVPYPNTFSDSLKAQIRESQPDVPEALVFKLNPEGLAVPGSPSDFTQAWHQPPVSQDLTGSCWCFSATSLLESEVHRQTGRVVSISEMFTVYCEFVEKARGFIRTRGDTAFTRGSQANAAVRLWKQYGCIPAEAWSGIGGKTGILDDRAMFEEMTIRLDAAKSAAQWNEDAVLADIRAILNHHMGTPPETFMFEGHMLDPKRFLSEILRINTDDFVDVLSLKSQPFFQRVEYKVADNWWHSADYHNVPLDDFIALIRQAVRSGFTMCIVGDNSEPGFLQDINCAVIPDFDIPAAFINDDARQMRFENESTTDDHAIHVVGYLEKDGANWYLIKDSGNRSRNGRHPGYMFYREDFIKLKMMNIMIHKDALGELAKRFLPAGAP